MPIYCWCVSWWAGSSLVPVIIFTMAALYHPDITAISSTSQLYFILPLPLPPHTDLQWWSGHSNLSSSPSPGLILVISVVGRLTGLNCPVNQILIITVFVFTSQRGGEEGLGVSSWDIFVCNQSSDQSNEWEDELSWRCKISQSVSWETQHSHLLTDSAPRGCSGLKISFRIVLFSHQKLNLPSQTRYTCGNSQPMRNWLLSLIVSSLLAY